MARATKSDVYIATQSGVAEIDGETCVFVRGKTRVRAGHALLLAVPDYFEPAGEHVHYDVEDASAEPGKKRGE